MKAFRLPMLRTVAGAWRRLATSRRVQGYGSYNDQLSRDAHLVTERELRLHRLRTEQPAYQRYAD
ncbi:hypothetical protein Deipr_0095 [Deinococcus proteolyticus MRP]|uniref:Uncharacterized protein n=1 Tax=Deinococcus proteolyticus (strain ATCC 35074 / DSM 20540 / JCM 6276 / NBRC 101906 / NCIMB 13154 / VKM Ac-1939 / CCM 2703 / MRP) TaxID=693977 RepID=F0RNN7_DEIPM|nr:MULTISPECIES: hypothetical protein [Deinococcus]ADY25270.1 hypothetical protein Deipr_0095 [Deinococcus proteolyticus MRP]MCY1703371.1 hypothetical protein [Deinococcus sp. SL84]